MSTSLPHGVQPGTDNFGWPSLRIDVHELQELLQECIAGHVQYGLGAKAPTMTARPGRDFHAIDCSGFVRWALYGAAGCVLLPDGSVCQHDWADQLGFKKSDVASGGLNDGAVRIAFLSPTDGGGVGHVVLITGGHTVESHGHCGPDSRPWTGEGWQGRCAVYVLMPPAPQGG